MSAPSRPLPAALPVWLSLASLDEVVALLDAVTATLRARHGLEVVVGFDDPLPGRPAPGRRRAAAPRAVGTPATPGPRAVAAGPDGNRPPTFRTRTRPPP